MRLKSNIFLWVSVATVLPLTVLSLAATAYSERLYLIEVGREVARSMNNTLSEVDRQLYYERQMVISLANSQAMRQYLPVLQRASEGNLHPEFFERGDRLERFLAGFQGVVPGFKILRVMDTQGNTLVKVRFGIGTASKAEGIEGFPYVEEEVLDDSFARQLKELTPGELSFVTLPPGHWEEEEHLRGQAFLNAAYPIMNDGKVVGYLAASFSGDQVDKILDVASRIHKGKLLVAELNPDNPEREGLVLYDDKKNLRFKDSDATPVLLRDTNEKPLLERVRQRPYGELSLDQNHIRTYYTEYLPYSNQLVSWVVAMRVDMKEISAPFNRIRMSLLGLVAISLLVSLLLAQVGARNLARPIVEMTRSLKRFAQGDHSVRVRIAGGADEILQMETSFNYMAETLEQARKERDKAQSMMLQGAKLASIGEMAAGIGHEINNPLNNILSLTKLLRRSIPEDNEKALRDVDSLREEALRASSIVKGILNFARQVPPHYSHFETATWLQETLSLVQQAAWRKHIAFRLDAAPDVWITGDRGQLQQVIVNLLLNAIYASKDDSKILLRSQAQGQQIMIEVRDHGRGIPPAVLERIYDPFFSTKPEGEGSGLGLSISLGIIERHHGNLKIENNVGGGVTATILLPLQASLEDRQTEPDTIQ